METEANVLVALLAVRALGGRSIPANHEVVKALKKPIQEAVEKGLLTEETRTEQIAVEGKPKPKTVTTKVVALTESGEAALRASADPEALAATQARAVTAAVEAIDALRRGLDGDREVLKQQVQAALAGMGAEKEAGTLGKDVEKIATLLEKLTEAVRKWEERRLKEAGAAEALAAKIDEGFAALRAKLDQALQGLPRATAPAPHQPAPAAPPAPPPKPPEPPAPVVPESLQTVLHKAYEELRAHHREYQEGMVDLPRLYHEARRARPDLSVADFHREVLALEGKRVLDLHIRNDVRDAPEADKGIRRNDKLYYLVYWPRT